MLTEREREEKLAEQERLRAAIENLESLPIISPTQQAELETKKQELKELEISLNRKYVVLCGCTGTGKSSIANMLIQGDIYLDETNMFEIGDSAIGVTPEISFVIGENFGVYDLIGLGELASGKVSHEEAIKKTRDHFSTINCPLNYICFVKDNKITEQDVKLFKVFKEIFREGESNFVIIVTKSGISWADNDENVNNAKKVFGDYPIISVDFPCHKDKRYAEPDKEIRKESLEHLLDKFSELNYEGVNLEVLSSSQKVEDDISKYVNSVPIAGSLYQLTSSGIYYMSGKPKVAKKRLLNGTSGIVLDSLSLGMLGVGRPAFMAINIGTRAGVEKFIEMTEFTWATT